MQYDVIVIGGGASGLMAAVTAAENNKKVVLIEKNKTLGNKLKISGGGRCNITHNEREVRKLLAHYGDAEQFLYSAFSQCSVDQTWQWFEGRGLPLQVEARNRVFPQSQKASDVCKLFVKLLKEHKVEVVTDCAVEKMEIEGNKISKIITNKGVFEGKSVVLATGGVSHPETGSTGDGFAWLRDLGHAVHEPTPNIVPLIVADTWIKDMPGVSFEDIKIIFYVDGRKVFSKDTKSAGKLLCTHFGLSGPLALNSSKQVADMLEEGVVTAAIDCFPNKNLGELEKYILGIFDQNKNKQLKNVFSEIAPKGASKSILSLLPHMRPGQQVNVVSKEARKELTKLLKSLPMTITGLMGFDKAVVADGGVDITEVDFKTMRSKRIENLFITGDLLNIERPSGGFSLQLCWTTGYVAGKAL
jgi:predicted Rossmann fold flavoprotein